MTKRGMNMFKTFKQLLGSESHLWTNYLRQVILYGCLSGLTMTFFIPVISLLLQGQTQQSFFWFIPMMLGVFFSLKLRQMTDRSGIKVGEGLLRNARHRIGEHVATLPVGWFTPENNARLSHIISKGMMEVAQLPAHLFTPIISGSIAPLVLIVALFIINPILGMIASIGIPIIVGILFLTAKLGTKTDVEFNRNTAQTSERIVEFAQAQSVLRAFSGDNSSTRFLQRAIETQQKSAIKLIIISTLSTILGGWIVQTLFALLFGFTVIWLNDLLALGITPTETITIVITLILINRFIDPLQEISNYGEAMRNGKNHLQAVSEIFAEQPLPMPNISQRARNGSIELENVSFAYSPESNNVLSDISLHIEEGEMIAIVGASGSGKTTLTRLLARFFDASKGSIRIGGIDIREMSEQDLTSQVSQIFQQNFLFQGSIQDNILMGKPNASSQDLEKVINASGMRNMIARLPHGLSTMVGEGGAKLSGGERQRITIARALLKNSKILLIDEATASLDAENQKIITENLEKLKGNTTIVVIAHQLSTIQMADRIIVLDQGKMVEIGTHDDLINRKGAYAQFWTIMSRTSQEIH